MAGALFFQIVQWIYRFAVFTNFKMQDLTIVVVAAHFRDQLPGPHLRPFAHQQFSVMCIGA